MPIEPSTWVIKCSGKDCNIWMGISRTPTFDKGLAATFATENDAKAAASGTDWLVTEDANCDCNPTIYRWGGAVTVHEEACQTNNPRTETLCPNCRTKPTASQIG